MSRCSVARLGVAMMVASGCYGEYRPLAEGSGSSTLVTSTTRGATGEASLESSDSVTSLSTGAPLLCEHVDIVIVTDVSISMAPFANGIANILIALGGQIEQTLADVGTYRFALAYNAPALVNQGAFSVPEGGEGCMQLGALVRGQDACVQEFGERPFLTDADDLGAGVTCLAQAVISGGVDAEYERPRILETLLALLGADEDPALAICNEGFHQSPDPLVVIVIADADDESDGTVLEAVARAVGTQGTSLENVGLFVIGADASQCPEEIENECGAEPACRVQDFIDRGFVNAGLEGNVRRFNICRSLEDDTAAVASSLLEQLTAVVVQTCSAGGTRGD